MKAACFDNPGPPEVIRLADLPRPEPIGTQILVKVEAVSVNPIDTYIRSGSVPMQLPKPFIVGCDLAGTVERVGPDAKQFKSGDRVWGSNQGLLGRQGTFAEYAAVDECWLYPAPDSIPSQTLAAIALVALTAHPGLRRCARLQAGETLFVNGGSGGVGSMVVQMAKALGARVIATAGSPEKLARCRELGADEALDYHGDNLAGSIKQLAPAGINVWWETQREPDFERAISLLAPRGRMIVMAGREARPVFPVGPFYVKNCSLHGFAMFNFTAAEQRESAAEILQWLDQGKLRPQIDRVLTLAETARAHRLQEENTLGRSGALAGKIVLTP